MAFYGVLFVIDDILYGWFLIALKSSYTACKLIAEEHSFFFYYSTTSELPYLFLYYLSNSRSPPYCKNAKSTFWPRYSQIHMSNHTQCQNKPRSMFLRSATGLFVYQLYVRCHWHPHQQCPLWWVRVSRLSSTSVSTPAMLWHPIMGTSASDMLSIIGHWKVLWRASMVGQRWEPNRTLYFTFL